MSRPIEQACLRYEPAGTSGRMLRVLACTGFLAAVLAASAAAAVHTESVRGCTAKPGTYRAATASYRFVLQVTMPQKMYTQAQVRQMHPKSGEVMLRGSMSAMGGSMAGMRHLEVQICTRASLAVVTNAMPMIRLRDDTTGKTKIVPVAVMEGIGTGVADLHYGNNVAMTAGHSFTVTVQVKGEKATFHFKLRRA